jgi:CHASE2 domain-containing sensor protein
MKRIFISYRRHETSGYSRLIHEQLEKLQPDWALFLDVEDIAAGSDWRQRLTERLDWADVVLVLVGREWLTLTDSEGRRRLDDPDDVTRWEIQEALRKRKHVIPVLLEDTAHLTEDVLPEPLRALARKQAVELRHTHFDTDLEALIGLVQQETLRERVEHAGRRLALEKARSWVPPALAVSVFCAFWVGLLDLLALDTRATTWAFAVAEAIAPAPAAQDLALLGLPAEFTTHADGARTQYAQALDRLRAAGATAVLFDLYFETARPAEDDRLVSAIEASITAGTDVFIGFRALDAGVPRAVEALRKAASGLGLVCVGARLGHAQTMPLAFSYAQARVEAPGTASIQHQAYPSLALLGAYGPTTVRRADAPGDTLVLERNGALLDVRFSRLDPIEKSQPGCPALQQGAAVSAIYLRLSPRDALRAPTRHFTLPALLEGTVDASHLKGRTVIIGHEAPADEQTVAYGLTTERRYGYELHADAIATLRSDRIARPVGPWPAFILMLLGATAGAWLGVRLREARAVARWPLLASLIAAYAAGAIWLVAHADLILHTPYDLFAFFSAYLVLRRRARRLLQPTQG